MASTTTATRPPTTSTTAFPRRSVQQVRLARHHDRARSTTVGRVGGSSLGVWGGRYGFGSVIGSDGVSRGDQPGYESNQNTSRTSRRGPSAASRWSRSVTTTSPTGVPAGRGPSDLWPSPLVGDGHPRAPGQREGEGLEVLLGRVASSVDDRFPVRGGDLVGKKPAVAERLPRQTLGRDDPGHVVRKPPRRRDGLDGWVCPDVGTHTRQHGEARVVPILEEGHELPALLRLVPSRAGEAVPQTVAEDFSIGVDVRPHGGSLLRAGGSVSCPRVDGHRASAQATQEHGWSPSRRRRPGGGWRSGGVRRTGRRRGQTRGSPSDAGRSERRVRVSRRLWQRLGGFHASLATATAWHGLHAGCGPPPERFCRGSGDGTSQPDANEAGKPCGRCQIGPETPEVDALGSDAAPPRARRLGLRRGGGRRSGLCAGPRGPSLPSAGPRPWPLRRPDRRAPTSGVPWREPPTG